MYDILNNDPTTKTSIEPMLSTIPSYTALGMASLLPHTNLKYDDKNILVDGQSSLSTNDRDKILKKYQSNAVAVQYDEIKSFKIQELREKYNDVNLIYIYHNQIDARGDNNKTEDEVFMATGEAIHEIKNLITKLTNSRLFSNFFVTADHGFIYKRDKLEESSKVDLSTVDSFYKNKRFLLTYSPIEIDACISFPLNYINNNDVYVTTPIGSGIFKIGGSGQNYVHGGASLEECMIPLLKVKTSTRSSSKMQNTVDLQLMSTNNKITNNICVFTFYQSENISSTVTPLEAKIYFEDENGEKISNEVIIYANKNTDSAEDREFKEKFTLMQKEYSKDKKYFMVIKDVKTNMEIKREEFIIDIAFQDGFSFF
ncbi:TIGR02687 family protein [Methanobrevibacter sp. 87.7]|nr:TIGR02687 family protein [Methanobrevibacter sp. 87.7]